MPSGPERPIGLAAIAGRALLYALAIVLLVLATPGQEHVFIYQGF